MQVKINTGEPVFLNQQAANQQITDWGHHVIMAPLAWKQTKGEGVKVAILDTGIDASHPDLVGNIRGGINFTTPNRQDWTDRQGHGSHCAGIVAGTDNNIGVIGVAPQAELYSVKVLGDNGYGDMNWVMQGVEWCIQNKMDIISMSLGSTQAPPPIYQEVYKKAYAAGIPIVAAAGNENQHVGWPAAYPETISVGAIDPKLDKANFSNFGAEVDIAAPGVDIYSTYPGGRYARLSGTSMATPMVTGALALLISQARKRGVVIPGNAYKQILQRASVDLGIDGHDTHFGHGLLNLVKLLG